MVDFIYNRLFVKIREMAFGTYNDAQGKGFDVAYLHSNDEKNMANKKKKYVAQKQYTLTSSLELTEEELLKKIKKNTKYEIRRAEKEQADFKVFTVNDSEEIINQILAKFEKTYNDMFSSKGMSNRFNSALLKAGIKRKQAVVTICSIGELSVYHAYLCDREKCVLMYSASPLWENGDKEKANCIGRMNKYLHWKDFQWFKANGYLIYEWGGITSPETPNGIDQFKMSFGGDIIAYYNYLIANSLIGTLYVKYVGRRIRSAEDNN